MVSSPPAERLFGGASCGQEARVLFFSPTGYRGVMVDTAVAAAAAGEAGQDEFKSAVEASLAKKEHSYYHAHARPREDLSEANVRSGEGLADGLGPKLVEGAVMELETQKVTLIENYAFSDEGGKVKLVLEFPTSLEDAQVTCKFMRFGMDLVAMTPEGAFGFRVADDPDFDLRPTTRREIDRKNGFHSEITPDACKYRVSSSGTRVSVTLVKRGGERAERWDDLYKNRPRGF